MTRWRRTRDGRALGMLTGIGLGAGLMYMLDPVSGKRRRNTVADRTRSLAHQSGEATERAARELGRRAEDLAAAARRPFVSDEAGWRQESWTPGLRWLAATAGSSLVACAIRRRGLLGVALGTAGAALISRAGTNRLVRDAGAYAPPAGTEAEPPDVSAPMPSVDDGDRPANGGDISH